MGESKSIWGWYPAGNQWLPIICDVTGRLIVDLTNVDLGDLGDVNIPAPVNNDLIYWNAAAGEWQSRSVPANLNVVLTTRGDILRRGAALPQRYALGALGDVLQAAALDPVWGPVTGANLGVTFGASAGRLVNQVMTPIAGVLIYINGLNTANSPFTALINGAPTATTVVYDTDVNEGSIDVTAGPAYWGRIVLHNLTRGTSRLIVSVNLVTNTITTENSVDAWANNDNLTTQSQTNLQPGYIDIDLSASVPATMDSLYIFSSIQDTTNLYQNLRRILVHPYQAYDAGRLQYTYADLQRERGSNLYILDIINQRMTARWENAANLVIWLNVIGFTEFADT